ncbi:MAG: prolyl oligopeptidase family serine peptidase [Planctomycetales bacterium]
MLHHTRSFVAVTFALFALGGVAAAGADPPESAAAAQAAWAKIAPFMHPPEEFRGKFAELRDVMKFDDGTPVRAPEDWPRRRKEILDTWHGILGEWPPLLKEPKIRIEETTRRENFTQHHGSVQVAENLASDAYLLVPDGEGPFPAVIVVFYEPLTGAGLGERGEAAKDRHDYGLQLVRRGIVALSIGTPDYAKGAEREQVRDILTELAETSGRQSISTLACCAANAHTALAARPDVDGERIGIIGLSYGGKWSLFASCLHDKFACAVWSDPSIVFDESLSNANYWDRWYLGHEKGTLRPQGMPSRGHARTGAYKTLIEQGRDLHELHALMAPRPFFVGGGREDKPHRWKVLNHAIQLNEFLGYGDRVGMHSRPEHRPSPEAATIECDFLEYMLLHRGIDRKGKL